MIYYYFDDDFGDLIIGKYHYIYGAYGRPQGGTTTVRRYAMVLCHWAEVLLVGRKRDLGAHSRIVSDTVSF